MDSGNCAHVASGVQPNGHDRGSVRDWRAELQRDARSPAAPAPGTGGIYFYRTSVFGAAIQPVVKLNGEVVSGAVLEGFPYVDRPLGDYTVTTATEVEKKLTFTLEVGQIRYVRLSVSMGLFVRSCVRRVGNEAVVQKEMDSASYIGSAK